MKAFTELPVREIGSDNYAHIPWRIAKFAA